MTLPAFRGSIVSLPLRMHLMRSRLGPSWGQDLSRSLVRRYTEVRSLRQMSSQICGPPRPSAAKVGGSSRTDRRRPMRIRSL